MKQNLCGCEVKFSSSSMFKECWDTKTEKYISLWTEPVQWKGQQWWHAQHPHSGEEVWWDSYWNRVNAKGAKVAIPGRAAPAVGPGARPDTMVQQHEQVHEPVKPGKGQADQSTKKKCIQKAQHHQEDQVQIAATQDAVSQTHVDVKDCGTQVNMQWRI